MPIYLIGCLVAVIFYLIFNNIARNHSLRDHSTRDHSVAQGRATKHAIDVDVLPQSRANLSTADAGFPHTSINREECGDVSMRLNETNRILIEKIQSLEDRLERLTERPMY